MKKEITFINEFGDSLKMKATKKMLATMKKLEKDKPKMRHYSIENTKPQILKIKVDDTATPDGYCKININGIISKKHKEEILLFIMNCGAEGKLTNVSKDTKY